MLAAAPTADTLPKKTGENSGGELDTSVALAAQLTIAPCAPAPMRSGRASPLLRPSPHAGGMAIASGSAFRFIYICSPKRTWVSHERAETSNPGC